MSTLFASVEFFSFAGLPASPPSSQKVSLGIRLLSVFSCQGSGAPHPCQCPLRNKNPFLYILSGVPSAKYSLVTDFRCYPKFLGVFNDTAGSLVLSSANSGFNPWFSSSARGSACVFKVPALPRSAQERILPASKDMSREFAGNFANWLTCF
jgi:hypothetical protein